MRGFERSAKGNRVNILEPERELMSSFNSYKNHLAKIINAKSLSKVKFVEVQEAV